MIFSMELSWQVLLGSLLTVAQAKSQSSKVSLYVGSMAPLTGPRSWWGAGITTAMQMAFELINNRSDILPYFELKLLENDTLVRAIEYWIRLLRASTKSVSMQFLETIPTKFNRFESHFILVQSLQNFHHWLTVNWSLSKCSF